MTREICPCTEDAAKEIAGHPAARAMQKSDTRLDLIIKEGFSIALRKSRIDASEKPRYPLEIRCKHFIVPTESPLGPTTP